MSGWPVVKLSDVAILSSGGTPSKARLAFWDGDIPWVSPKDMKSNPIVDAEDRITRTAVSESAARIVGSNSVLAVVRSGILAHTFPVATLSRDVSFNQDIKAITPKNGSLLPLFLFWMLKGQEAHILRIGVKKGATVHSLANGFLEALRFPLPPVEEQRRIVRLLDRAAEIRRRAHAARAKARGIIPTLFVDTFGDPATNPKGWPVMTVGDLPGIELRNGISPSKSGKVIGNVLTLSAITRGSFDPCARKESTFAATLVEDQTVSQSLFLICRGNGNRHLVGQGAFPTCDMPGVAFPDTMIALRVMGAEIAPAYLAAVWSSPHLKAQIAAAAKTTNGTFKISQGAIVRFAFPLPPRELQTAFAEQVERLESLTHHLDAAAAKANAMAAGLSAEVFGSSASPARRDAA